MIQQPTHKKKQQTALFWFLCGFCVLCPLMTHQCLPRKIQNRVLPSILPSFLPSSVSCSGWLCTSIKSHPKRMCLLSSHHTTGLKGKENTSNGAEPQRVTSNTSPSQSKPRSTKPPTHTPHTDLQTHTHTHSKKKEGKTRHNHRSHVHAIGMCVFSLETKHSSR